jgi:CHAD domain-containing protein
MASVLEQLRRVQKSADADAVHDLRVTIRRCRSVAAVMEEVDGHRTWRAVKALPRRLFRALGTLRDLHVLEAKVKQLAPTQDPLRSRLLDALKDRRRTPRKLVRRAVQAFDHDRWERLARKAAKRARLVPPDSLTARCLVLERFADFQRLHARAVRTETPGPWHALRVGGKRFRYAVEILTPARSVVWDEGLGQIQDLLGEIHDLDVFRTWINRESDALAASSSGSIRRAIAARRRECIESYRQRMFDGDDLLGNWRSSLPDGDAIESATAARLRTTARAMDPHPRRTAAVARLALAIYDGLVTSGTWRRLRDRKLRNVLRWAAELHAIQVDGRRSARHKAAGDFLRALPVPLSWRTSEWELLALVVRYHRGAEPAVRHRQFRRLSQDRQERVRKLAGVLRLARGLYRCGVTTPGDIRLDESAEYVRLRICGVQDTEDNAARLAIAKHLLETALRRPVLIECAKAAASARAPRVLYSTARFGAHMAADARRLA